MLKEPELDFSELQKLKGIGVGVTSDDQPFLVLTCEEKTIGENAFPWILWTLAAAMVDCGLVMWLMM